MYGFLCNERCWFVNKSTHLFPVVFSKKSHVPSTLREKSTFYEVIPRYKNGITNACNSPDYPSSRLLGAQRNLGGITSMVNRFCSLVTRLHRDEAGQGLVEYALIMGLVVFAAVTTMQSLASEINAAFAKITSTLTSAIGS